MWRTLLTILLLPACGPLAAQTVYQCRQDGVLVFQDRACGAGQVVRELAPPPAGDIAPGIAEMVASWEARAAARRGDGGAKARAPRNPRRNAGPTSHRCTSAGGAVFYRHGACPARIATTRAATGTRRKGRGGGDDEAVSDETVPRELACGEMQRAGAITRKGREHDAQVDTYERNLGRDPCR
jgi:hypothetical protein